MSPGVVYNIWHFDHELVHVKPTKTCALYFFNININFNINDNINVHIIIVLFYLYGLTM